MLLCSTAFTIHSLISTKIFKGKFHRKIAAMIVTQNERTLLNGWFFFLHCWQTSFL